MDQIREELLEHPPRLSHVSEINDKSAPATQGAHLHTWDKAGLLSSIEAGVALKHVETIDKAVPMIEPDVHVKPSQRKEMLTELRSAAGHAAVMRELHAIADAAGAGEGDEDADAGPIVAQLHHIETVDKAAPAIEPGMHVGQWDKQGFLEEVAAPHKLRHVPPSQARAAARTCACQHTQLQGSICDRASDCTVLQLLHAQVADRSAPSV